MEVYGEDTIPESSREGLRSMHRLSNIERGHLSTFLLQHEGDGKTSYNMRRKPSTRWNVSMRTISRLAALQRNQQRLGLQVNLNTKVKGKKGRPVINIDTDRVLSVALQLRTTQRTFAAAMEVSRSTLRRWIHGNQLRSHSNAIKPQISDANQLRRLQYCIHHLKHDIMTTKTTFKDMHHVVHIDEKWFFLTRVAEKYYLLPEELEPHRTVQNKRYITKVMFLCATCRPIFDEDGGEIFDGKIGIWPIVTKEAAKKKSKNRPAGTMIIAPEKSVNRDVTKKYMLEKLLPAIKQKWPLLASTNIFVQQDNARPHITDGDLEWRAAASSDSFNIRLGFQPPQSPDLNVLDLGFFRYIQSLQHETATFTIDGLIQATETAFSQLQAKTLDRIFLTLQGCMVEIMKGSNRYKVPHMKKDELDKLGLLPTDLEVDGNLVRACLQYLQSINRAAGFQRLIEQFTEV